MVIINPAPDCDLLGIIEMARFMCESGKFGTTIFDNNVGAPIIAFGSPTGYELARRVCAKLNAMPLAIRAVEAESKDKLQGLYFLCTKLAQEIGE
jgi:hypothetical protein